MTETLKNIFAVRSQLATALQKYLQLLIDLPDSNAAPYLEKRRLTDLYITPTIQRREKKKRDANSQSLPSSYALMGEGRIREQHTIILGRPGEGKTLLMQMTARSLAEKSLVELNTQCKAVSDIIVPIYLRLEAISKYGLRQALKSDIADLISPEHSDKDSFYLSELVAGHLVNQLFTERCWLFLDGLDEVLNPARLKTALKPLNTAGTRVTLTSRQNGYDRSILPFNSLAEYELATFIPKQRLFFFNNWYGNVEIAEIFQENSDLEELTRNPLLLTLCCAHINRPKKKNNKFRRIDLYSGLTRDILQRRWKNADVGNINELLALIQAVAWWLYKADQHSRTFSYSKLRQAIVQTRKEHVFTDDPKAIVEELLSSGIIVSTGKEEYQFVHSSFMDFLAAEHIASQEDPVAQITRELRLITVNGNQHFWLPEAEELLSFLADRLPSLPLLQHFLLHQAGERINERDGYKIQSSPANLPLAGLAFSDQIRLYAKRIHQWERLKDLGRYHLRLVADCASEEMPLNSVMSRHPRLIITGPPGGGKSIFLLKELKAFCSSLIERIENSRHRIVVPVYLELGDFKSHHQRLVDSILVRLGIPSKDNSVLVLTELLDNCDLVLLLDGLNETAKEHRERLAGELFDLDQVLIAHGKEDRLRVVITSRIYGFNSNHFEEKGYQIAELLPLRSKEIEEEILRSIPFRTRTHENPFQQMDVKVRQFLSNAQHLDYALEWISDKIHTEGDWYAGLRSRGELIRYCVDKKLSRLGKERIPSAQDVLSKLAYRTAESGSFFAQADALKVINPDDPGVTAHVLLEDLIEMGLLVRFFDANKPDGLKNNCRFVHHSIQQYFAACRMKTLWSGAPSSLDTFIKSELWHEPLVIMAGILDSPNLHRLLKKVETNSRLYAYILANVNEPEIEDKFVEKTVKAFVQKAHRSAVGLVRLLSVALVAWVFLFPAAAWLLTLGSFQKSVTLSIVVGVGYFLVCPILGVIIKRLAQYRLAVLRGRELPSVVVSLRFLLAKGPLKKILNELVVLQRRLNCDEEDPRKMFINEAIALVRPATKMSSYMTEDEMLESLDDPWKAAAFDPGQLSDKGVEKLCARALELANEPTSLLAMDALREVYAINLEHRGRLAEVFQRIASDENYSYKRRARAAMVCRDFGILFHRKHSFWEYLLSWLRSLFRS